MYKNFFKRIFDFFLSFLALVVLSPLILLLIILGSIFMKGNPFFTQKRPGKKDKNGNEKIFKLIKFRTMTNAKDKDGHLLPDSDRLNGYGKFLRSTSLDELPELFNILVGNMAIIGPRPQLVRDMVFMSDEQRNRHNVRPGLSGLAQVKGRNSISWEDKLDWDLKYIKKITLFGDISLIFQTVIKVFKRDGITAEGEATAEDFGDYLLSTGKISKEEYDQKQEKSANLLTGGGVNKWIYYNHALIPNVPPHICLERDEITKQLLKQFSNNPLLIRYISDFDCKQETKWWYIIKDTQFNLDELNSNKRYKIKKGIKYFDIKILNPINYSSDLYNVYMEAQKTYPTKNRSNISFEHFKKGLETKDSNIKYYIAFSKETNKPVGYAIVPMYDDCCELKTLKVDPNFEKYQVNAAIIYSILLDVNKQILTNGKYYICDGSRNINHETNFQNYLETNFHFRKAYCKLHIVYSWKIKWIVYLMYPFRKVLKLFDNIKIFHLLNGILKMEECRRK